MFIRGHFLSSKFSVVLEQNAWKALPMSPTRRWEKREEMPLQYFVHRTPAPRFFIFPLIIIISTLRFLAVSHWKSLSGGVGVRPASQNPYPIYDQDLPYLWPDQNFDTLFMSRYPISCQNGRQIAKIDTLFMAKKAEKPYPLGPLIPI